MKTTKLLIVSLASLFLISCGGGGNADSALSTNGHELRGKMLDENAPLEEQEVLSPSGITRGRISYDDKWLNDTQQIFDAKLRSFLSPQLNASQVGEVSGSERSTDTGISFWGRGLRYRSAINPGLALTPQIVFQEEEGVFDPSTAELRISIFQKNTKNDDNEDNDVIEEIAIHFNDQLDGNNSKSGELIDSVVSGKYVQLIFADSYGKLSLSGIFTNDGTDDYYEGQVLFKNLKDISGKSINHTAEVLGKFKIRVCGLFACNQ